VTIHSRNPHEYINSNYNKHANFTNKLSAKQSQYKTEL